MTGVTTVQIMKDYKYVIVCLVIGIGGSYMGAKAVIEALSPIHNRKKPEIIFLDEPTVNLDVDRRFEIADVIKDYSKELRQLFVISHDDTFESITTNILKIEKVNNESELG